LERWTPVSRSPFCSPLNHQAPLAARPAIPYDLSLSLMRHQF
jgi:hypothetical protein